MPESYSMLSKDFLLRLGGLQAPTRFNSAAKRKTYDLFVLRYVQLLKDEVLKSTGRMLTTVWGEGFRLASPQENVILAESRFSRKVQTEIQKARKVYKYTRNEDLNMTQRAEKHDAQVRLGLFEVHFLTYDEERDQSVKKYHGADKSNGGLAWSEGLFGASEEETEEETVS
jgi:hypothetical protein